MGMFGNLGSGGPVSLLSRGGLPNLRQVLMGSSFDYSRLPEDGAGGPGRLEQWSTWGRTASTRFGGADGPMSIDVSAATAGLDSRWGPVPGRGAGLVQCGPAAIGANGKSGKHLYHRCNSRLVKGVSRAERY